MHRAEPKQLTQADLLLDLPPDPTAPDPLAAVLGSLIGTFAVFALIGLAVLGFVGGSVPLTGWELSGGLVAGFLWLGVLATAGVIVLWFVPLLVSMVVYALLSRTRPAVAWAAHPYHRHPQVARHAGDARGSRAA